MKWDDLRYFLAVTRMGTTIQPRKSCVSMNPLSDSAYPRGSRHLARHFLSGWMVRCASHPKQRIARTRQSLRGLDQAQRDADPRQRCHRGGNEGREDAPGVGETK